MILDLKKMENAMTLVEFDKSEENNLKVCEEALQKIENLPPTYGIKATAIVGPGRIGKSSLLNWLVGKNVFKIGSKTSRVTKGIWMYIEEDKIRNLANIYIDVEGFGDPAKSNVDEHDNRLLNIVTQICDVVLYNIRGVYDSDMRDKIKFVCSLFNRYRKGNSILEKPILVSVLRDFDLDPTECPDTEFQNLFRKDPELLDTFRQTKAFTLVKPKEGRVIDLANTPDSELCEEFLQGRNEIKKYLTNNTKPLRAASKKNINGIVLAENIRRTVKHVNNDDLRMLSKSLPEILKEENDTIKKSTLDSYKTEMKTKWPLPSEPETLMELHEMEKNAAVEHIDKKCFTISGSIEIDEQAFKVEIENMFKEMQKVKCKEALKSAVSEISHKLEREAYFEDGGEKCFLYDYDKAENVYTECKNLGNEKSDIWENYNAEMNITKELIKQKAKVLDMKKSAAASEKVNKETTEELEKTRKQFEVMRKKLERRENNDGMWQGILNTGKLLVDICNGVNDIYLTAANTQGPDPFFDGARSLEARPSGGSSVSPGGARYLGARPSGGSSASSGGAGSLGARPSGGSSVSPGGAGSLGARPSGGARSLEARPSGGSSASSGGAGFLEARPSGGAGVLGATLFGGSSVSPGGAGSLGERPYGGARSLEARPSGGAGSLGARPSGGASSMKAKPLGGARSSSPTASSKGARSVSTSEGARSSSPTASSKGARSESTSEGARSSSPTASSKVARSESTSEGARSSSPTASSKDKEV